MSAMTSSADVMPVMINLVHLDQGMSHVSTRPIGKQTTRPAMTAGTLSHLRRFPVAR